MKGFVNLTHTNNSRIDYKLEKLYDISKAKVNSVFIYLGEDSKYTLGENKKLLRTGRVYEYKIEYTGSDDMWIQYLVCNELTNYLSREEVQNLISSVNKSTSYTFETYDNFISWLFNEYVREDGKTTADLNIGDNIYIKETGVPDYWCNSISTPFTIDNFTAYETEMNFVRYDINNQSLSDIEKENARVNIGAVDSNYVNNAINEAIGNVSDLLGNTEDLEV